MRLLKNQKRHVIRDSLEYYKLNNKVRRYRVLEREGAGELKLNALKVENAELRAELEATRKEITFLQNLKITQDAQVVFRTLGAAIAAHANQSYAPFVRPLQVDVPPP